MMCRKQSSRWQSAKLLLVLPMVAISLSAFATTVYVTRESHDKDNENSYNNKNWKKAVIEIAGSKILLNDKQVTPEELDACIEEYILQTLIYNANDAESVKTYESIYNTLKKNRAIDQIYPNGERPTSTIHLNGDKIYLNGELISLEDIKKRVEEINSHTISITANGDANEKHIAELKEAIHHTGNVLKLNPTQDSDDPTKAKFYAEQVEKIVEQMKFFDEMKSEYEAVMKEFEALKDEFEKNDEKAYVEMQKQFTEMQKQFAEFENHYGELDSVIAKRMALIKEYSKNGNANIRLEGGKIYLDGKLTSAEKLEKYFAENKKLINIKVADDKSGEALAKVKELARQNQILTINYEQVRFLPVEEQINKAQTSQSKKDLRQALELKLRGVGNVGVVNATITLNPDGTYERLVVEKDPKENIAECGALISEVERALKAAIKDAELPKEKKTYKYTISFRIKYANNDIRQSSVQVGDDAIIVTSYADKSSRE